MFFLLVFMISILQITFLLDRFLFKLIVDSGTEYSAGGMAPDIFIQILLWILLAYGVLKVVQIFGTWFRIGFLSILDGNLIANIKRKYFNHIVTLDYEFHTTHKTGSLISRMGRGSSAAENMTDILAFNFVPLVIQLIAVAISFAYFSLATTFVVIGVVVAFIGWSLFMQNIQQSAKLEFNKKQDIEKGNVADIFTNVDSIKYFGKENLIKGKFLKLISQTKQAAIKFWNLYRAFDAGQLFILGVGTVLTLLFPLLGFIDGEVSIGTVVFIYTVYGSVVGNMFSFVHGIRGFYRAMADFQYLFDYGKIKRKVKDKPNAGKLKITAGEIEFKDVSFYYGKRKLFEDFNLNIPKNKKYAFVGHSGSGKTSLIRLLYRFFDINSGKLVIPSEYPTSNKYYHPDHN